MELWINLGSILLGVAALYYGAEWLVKGSSAIALRLGISPLVVGLTIVALGTSSPELFVCVGLNLSGNSDTAIGNVIGSNICNILLILGISAVIRPIVIKAQLVYRDGPILVGASLLMWWLISDSKLVLWEGILLTALILAYIFISFRWASQEKNPEVLEEFESEFGSVAEEQETASGKKLLLLMGLIVVGIAVLVVGANLLKDGAIAIATAFGVSEAIIGLTIVAIGTSLPELATSMVASARNEGDIIAGNAIGSSIFNIFAILGVTVLFGSMTIGGIEPMDLAFMIGSAVVVVPLMWTRRHLSRIEGVALLVAYGTYMALLVQRGGAG